MTNKKKPRQKSSANTHVSRQLEEAKQSASPTLTPPRTSAEKAPTPTWAPGKSESEDEDSITEAPRLRGALHGLDMSNMLAPPDTRHSPGTVGDGRQIMPAETPQHETRASRHGKTYVNYSAKWHPMDEVMRPKRARRLVGGSASRRGADDSDDSEQEPFSGGDTGEEDDDDEMSDIPFEREPDAKATRRSARSEAKKPVNYSKAHHPQDHLLPGYRNRAKRQRRSTPSAQPRKRKTSNETVVLSSQTIADSDNDGSDASEDDCIQLQAADPAITTATASPPREQTERQSARQDHTIPTDAANNLHHLHKAVPNVLRGESSTDTGDAIVRGLLHHIDRSGLDSQLSSKAVAPNHSDEDIDNQSTEALISGASENFASAENTAAIGSDQEASKHVQKAPGPVNHSALRVSHHATVMTNLLTPCSAMNKSTQAGSPGLTIARPYSSHQVEPSVKCQPSSSQDLKDAAAPELDVLPREDACEDEPAKLQERGDALLSQADPSQDERHESSDVALHHDATHTQQMMRGLSDLSSRADTASHDSGDRMNSMSPASRQASRETQPEMILANESFFDEATSSSQSGSKGSQEDEERHTSTVASPKLPKFGQQQVEGNAPDMQLVLYVKPLAAAGEVRSRQTVDDPQKGVKSKEDRMFESDDSPKGFQSHPASSVPAEPQWEMRSSSSTQSKDRFILAEIDM